MKKERAPAQIVSCPHCSWKGSARGLYTHCRMGHPNKALPETKGTRVWATIHPQGEKPVKSTTKPIKSKKRSRLEYEDRVLRLIEIYIKGQMGYMEQNPTNEKVYQLAGIPLDSELNKALGEKILKELGKIREK